MPRSDVSVEPSRGVASLLIFAFPKELPYGVGGENGGVLFFMKGSVLAMTTTVQQDAVLT